MPSTENPTADLAESPAQASTECNAQDVLRYLQQHPAFIEEHPEILESLQLHHQQDQQVTSLIERQLARMRENNTAHRRKIAGLVENVQENDQQYAKTRRQVHSIISASSFYDMTRRVEHALLYELEADASVLTLFGERSTSIDNQDTNAANRPGTGESNIVPIHEAQHAIRSIISNSGAICGCFRPHELAFLFNDPDTPVRSAAVAPLGEDNSLGILAVGNRNPDHYHSTIGTLFLNYITEVLNICLPRLLQHQGEDAR